MAAANATAAAASLVDGHSGVAEPLCLAWGHSIVESPMLCVGCSDGSVQLWLFDEARSRSWVRLRAFDAKVHPGGRVHADCVRSVAWAADMGRSYQLIATASRDKSVKLWALRRDGGGLSAADDEEGGGGDGGGAAGGGGGGEGGAWSASLSAELPHRSQVWRVSWNAAGSMLASSEDDGTVRCFQMDGNGGWRHAAP